MVMTSGKRRLNYQRTQKACGAIREAITAGNRDAGSCECASVDIAERLVFYQATARAILECNRQGCQRPEE
jgi:hypothetical protein